MLTRERPRARQTGTTMLEVLVTIVILAFGMLGLAGLQLKTGTAEMESYQRTQALVLMNDMVERITANRNNAANAADYPSATVWGTGDTTYDATPYHTATDCSTLGAGTKEYDWCEWTRALKGSSETIVSPSATSPVGAMIGARGCISTIQAKDETPGICKPGIYEVAVAWQGLASGSVPGNACGQGLYGPDDSVRRLVATRITVGLPSCN